MPRGILITGTDVRVGKTLVGCALAFAAHSRAIRVGVMKPIETGCREVSGILEPADARGLSYAAATDLPLEVICPYRYRSPLAPAAAAEADKTPPPDLTEIADAYRKIAARCDFVIVEGSGGIMTPIAWGATGSRPRNTADLARVLNVDIVIVVANRPGCLNPAILTIHYAKSRGLGIIGMILNDIDAEISTAMETNQESLQRMTDVTVIGRVRFKQPVTREIVDAILRQ